MTDEELEKERNESYESGIISGIERIAEEITSESAVLFKNGRDDQAHQFRELGKRFLNTAKIEREEWRKKYPYEAK